MCSFISDTYLIFDMLAQQSDITVLQVKDYIAEPKPNGYKSLHAIIEIPVFLSSGPVQVPVDPGASVLAVQVALTRLSSTVSRSRVTAPVFRAVNV